MPARLDVLTELSTGADRHMRVLSQNALRGRSLPNHSLLGLVEERLIQTLGGLWHDVLDPTLTELRPAIHTPLIRLAAQLNNTLARSTGVH